MLDKIKDNIPLISLVLLVICLIRVIVFYWFFGITITEYIELSELFSLMSGYLIFQFVAILTYLCLVVAWTKRSTRIRYIPLFNIDLPISIFGYILDLIDSKKGKIIAGAIGVLICGVLWLAYKLDDVFILCVLLFFMMIAYLDSFAVLYGNKFKKLIHEADAEVYNRNLKYGIITLSIIILLLWGNFLATYTSAYALKNSEDDNRVAIEYESNLIRTSPNYLYVGRVKNYTFFYNKQTNRAHVYPNSGIKRVYIQD